jgi:preprotein translocase subunit SecG
MSTLITILHVIVCLFLMLTVLLQSGKSGGMGAAFGGGNAATVFGGSGASSFLRRLTAGAATIFMLASMTLAFIASHNSGDALEKFGAAQQDIAAQKEKEKERALGSGAVGSNAGSAANGSAVAPVSSSMGAPDINDKNPAGSAVPTTGDTPILGSGYAPGPATHPTPAPNSSGAANPPPKDITPTTTDPNATKPPVTSTPKATPPAPKAATPAVAPAPAAPAPTPPTGSATP